MNNNASVNKTNMSMYVCIVLYSFMQIPETFLHFVPVCKLNDRGDTRMLRNNDIADLYQCPPTRRSCHWCPAPRRPSTCTCPCCPTGARVCTSCRPNCNWQPLHLLSSHFRFRKHLHPKIIGQSQSRVSDQLFQHQPPTPLFTNVLVLPPVTC